MKFKNRNKLRNYCFTTFTRIIFILIIWLQFFFHVGCKVKKPPVFDISHPDSIYKWNQKSKEVWDYNTAYAKNNPYGFTDTVREKQKAAHIFRIAVLGDSFIWGDGLPYEKAWSHKLETKILDKYENIEVMSWGLCGWSTFDEIEFFKKEGYKYEIDLLIIGLVENDPEIKEVNIKNLTNEQYINSIYSKENLKEYTQLLKEFNLLQKEHQFKVIFVVTPLCIYDVYEKHLKSLLKTFKKAGITYLNLYPLLKNKFAGTPCHLLFANPINGHPGELLTEFYSEEVLKYLENNKYLINRNLRQK